MLVTRVTLRVSINATVTLNTWKFAGAWKTHLVTLIRDFLTWDPEAGGAGDPIPQWVRVEWLVARQDAMLPTPGGFSAGGHCNVQLGSQAPSQAPVRISHSHEAPRQ